MISDDTTHDTIHMTVIPASASALFVGSAEWIDL